LSIIHPQYTPDTVMEPVEPFAADLDGRNIVMVPNRDRVTADHELVKRYPTFFRPVEGSGGEVKYETEAASDNPGEHRARQRPTSRGTTEKET
jgi:hypothetical protein